MKGDVRTSSMCEENTAHDQMTILWTNQKSRSVAL